MILSGAELCVAGIIVFGRSLYNFSGYPFTITPGNDILQAGQNVNYTIRRFIFRCCGAQGSSVFG